MDALPVEITELIKKKRFDDVEALWMERAEKSPEKIGFFTLLARDLGRAGEKKRAATLLQLQAASLAERGKWTESLTLLKRAGAISPETREIRDAAVDLLGRAFPGRPGFNRYLSHTGLAKAGKLPDALEEMERLLTYDVGQYFELKARGVGKVVEVRPELRKIRITFPSAGDVSFKLDEAAKILRPVSQDNFLVRKDREPDELRRMVEEDPAALMESLFAGGEGALPGKVIRERLAGIVPEKSWTRWWNKAKSLPQLLPSGAGARIAYRWQGSAGEAEETIRTEFDRALLPEKIVIARRHRGRSEELDRHMGETLVAVAGRSVRRHPGAALEALLFAQDLPGAGEEGSGRETIDELLAGSDPVELIESVSDSSLRQKALAELRSARPDSWVQVYADLFLRVDDSRLLDFIFDALEEPAAGGKADEVANSVLANPRRFPRSYFWVLGRAVKDERIRERLGPRTPRHLLESYKQPEFRPWRNRIPALFEEPVLIESSIDKASAAEARQLLSLLLGDCGLPGHVREKTRQLVIGRFPEFGEKDKTFLSSQQAISKKREEYRKLTEQDIPRNSADIGRAAALGDLSENHEYKAAREKQLLLMSQAHSMAEELDKARPIDPETVPRDKVGIGSRVRLRARQGDATLTVTILGPWDSDPDHHVISYHTPLGEDFMEKAVGDTVEMEGTVWEISALEVWTEA